MGGEKNRAEDDRTDPIQASRKKQAGTGENL